MELNGQYWRTTSTGVDTNPGAERSHGVTAMMPFAAQGVVVRTLQIGTLLVPLDTTRSHAPSVIGSDQRMQALEREVHQPILGILGMPAWRVLETIIDYRHQHLTLIQLDSLGHRLAPVPGFTLVDSMVLIHTPDDEHYGLRATAGDSLIELMLDTGAESNALGGVAQARLQPYLVPAGRDSALDAPQVRLAHLAVGHTTYALSFTCQPGADMLGAPFLQHLGVVGFNFQTARLYVYH